MLFLKTSSGSENKPAWGGSLPVLVSALDSGAARGGPEAAGGRRCPLLLLLLHGARAPGRPWALAVLRPRGPWSYPGGHVTAGIRLDIGFRPTFAT